jgi:3-oxoacyl-[acyl-carrier protein] reductase
MAGRLQGKVAIVTGSARGIGAAITALFSAHGARVVGLDRQHAEASATSTVVNLTVDITRPDQVVAAVRSTLERFERIDALGALPRHRSHGGLARI